MIEYALGFLIFVSGIFLVYLMRLISRQNQPSNGGYNIKRIGRTIVLIRNGDVLELKKNAQVFEDGTIIVDKNKLYRVEKKKPYLLKMGRGTYQLYILDANTNALYQFDDPPKDAKTGKLNPVILNPKTLYNYIASHSIQKLLGKITVSKGEAVLYMFTGMVIIILLIFFVLPLLGHSIIIR